MTTTAANPTKLTEVHTDMEAAMIVAALEEHGIEAHLTGEFTSGFKAEAPGNVNILVSETDLTRAQQVLREFGNQEDAETIEEAESEFSFRKLSRITVIVGLALMGIMYFVDFCLMVFRAI